MTEIREHGRSSREKVGNKPDPIPLDLTIEILARLPVKSLVRFRCVAKLWSSIICRQDFINSFLIQSSTHPRLLVSLSVTRHFGLFVFSSPHPQNPKDESSSSCIANHHLTLHQDNNFYELSDSLRGLVCIELWDRVLVCNPSTRQLLTLPSNESVILARRMRMRVSHFFGYDPIDDQYKVLCVILNREYGKRSTELQIFTLGARNSWRTIEGTPRHYPVGKGACIDGVLYYKVCTSLTAGSGLGSFDIRSEKFNFVRIPAGVEKALMEADSILTSYQEKLAVVYYSTLWEKGRINLWVREDAEKEEWSKKRCVLPPSWRAFARKSQFYIPCALHTGEIILAPSNVPDQFYVLYYDTKMNSIKRVEFEGIADHEFRRRNGMGNHFRFSTFFSDHVENIMFL